MVRIVQLEPDIAVAPQLIEGDFAEIARRGFRSIVNIRPDGEAPDQLPHAKADAAARRHGLAFRYQPVMNVHVTDGDVVDDFARLMDRLPKPILFYCGTSTRCAILWSQAAAGRLGLEEILAVTHKAGYDLDFLHDTLAERAEWPVAAPVESAALPTLAG